MQIVRKKLTPDELTPPNIRFVDNVYQQTFDGGATWADAPALDPRTSDSFRAPALATDDPQCDAAANMVEALRQMVDALGHASSIVGVGSLLFGIFFFFVPFGWIADVILLVVEGIIVVGITPFVEAMTEDVYDQFLCIFYENIDADGQMSQSQLDDIYDAVAAQFDATIQGGFGSLSGGFGPVGWSNAGALGTETGDCIDCNCDGCYQWDFVINEQGFEVCSIGDWDTGAWHQVCSGGFGSTATCNIGQGFGPTPLPVDHVELDLSFDGSPLPTDWYVYGLNSDTGTCGGDQVLLASGSISASGTVMADFAETPVYGFQLIIDTPSGCGTSDCLTTAFRIHSTDLCAIGLSPNC